MNTKRTVPLEFRPGPGFELETESEQRKTPLEQAGAFEELQARLLQEAMENAAALSLRHLLKLAAGEAAGLAWTTPFPLLVYPCLFHEKTGAVRLQAHRQAGVQARSEEMSEALK